MVAMAAKKGNKKGTLTARIAGFRIWVQAAFTFVWVNPLLRMHNMCSPVFHCHSCPWATFACPIGVIAHFSALHVFPFVAIGVIVMFGAMFGGFVCGWMCPFGFLQDLAAKVPTPKFDIPDWMGYFRYVVLIGLVLMVPWLLGEHSPWFPCSLCPAGALEGAVPNVAKQMAAAGQDSQEGDQADDDAEGSGDEETADAEQASVGGITWPSKTKLAILGVFLIAIFFIRRPWCRIFCPLGAFYGLFNRASFFLVRFHDKKCVECEQCRSVCQYGGRCDEDMNTIKCNRCLTGAQCRAITMGTALDRVDDE
jgi:ferredoxin